LKYHLIKEITIQFDVLSDRVGCRVTAEFWCGKEGGPAKSSAEVVNGRDSTRPKLNEVQNLGARNLVHQLSLGPFDVLPHK
jgi:hypothetical protein